MPYSECDNCGRTVTLTNAELNDASLSDSPAKAITEYCGCKRDKQPAADYEAKRKKRRQMARASRKRNRR